MSEYLVFDMDIHSENNTAFILCAGFGTRLAPLTNFVPKALFPIVNRTALEIIIRRLSSRKSGIKSFYINAYHLAEQISAAANSDSISQFGANVKVVVELPKILGTAGGIGNLYRNAGKPDGTILVHNGDVIEDFDIEALYYFHRKSGAAATLVLVDNPQTNSVICDGKRVIAFRSGEGSTYSGVSLIEPNFLKTFPHNKFASLVEYLRPYIKRGLVFAYKTRKFWCDYGTLNSYLELHRKILVDSAMQIDGAGEHIYISPDADVHPDAEIGGFAAIGKNAQIPAGCTIINSIVWKNTNVKPGKYVNTILTPYGKSDV